MAYFVLQDFRAGVNVTRPAFAAEPGTLQVAKNCHLTRGGDLEKRKAFVSKYTLPAGTFGLTSLAGALYVFGSIADPGVPAGITYQRLQNGAKVMAEVLMAERFNGKLYVIVRWDDASQSHFYDGTIIADVNALGTSVRTFKSKVYLTENGNLRFCAIDTPTDFTTVADGAGTINLSNYAAGGQELITTARYYSQLAVFARETILVWTVVADPLENEQTQEIPDVGVIGRKATATYRDGAVYFFSDQGIKALQARDSSNFADVSDVSLPIDPLLLPRIRTASDAQRAATIMVVEPEEGRLWAVLGNSIYVYSYFPSAKIRAWTEYTPGFEISSIALAGRRLYARAGDVVYLYGGDDNASYDTATVDILLPYVTMQAPATFKNLYALDFGIEGTWDFYMRPEPSGSAEEQIVSGYTGVSFDQPSIPVTARGSHFSVRARHQTAEYARLSSVAMHYKSDEAN